MAFPDCLDQVQVQSLAGTLFQCLASWWGEQVTGMELLDAAMGIISVAFGSLSVSCNEIKAGRHLAQFTGVGKPTIIGGSSSAFYGIGDLMMIWEQP